MKLFFGFVCLLWCAACTDNENKNPSAAADDMVHARANDTVVTNLKPIALAGCYKMIMKRDTAQLSIQLNDTVITGTLSYRWYEKDRNEGMLKGVLKDSLIVGDYTFQSEGTTSVREVVFKIKSNLLYQATSDITEQQNKVVFKDPSHLQYDTVHPFIKTACNAK